MKCPKCGYLGFETTDRCRNCHYDFSLAPLAPDPELTLHGAEHKRETPSDFEWPSLVRSNDSPSTIALDLDRLFGAAEPAAPVLPAADTPALTRGSERPAIAAPEGNGQASLRDESELPFDDAPLMPPPAARPPLAVRRSTPDLPRNRPRVSRSMRTDALELESASPKPSDASMAATATAVSVTTLPSLAVRVGAGLIDLVLLAAIDAVVLYLTLRVTGLANTLEDLRVLPPIPFVGFLAVLAFGYVAAFTVAGGQTIGKMALSLRVIGDDGRAVDAAGGMLRALGCMLVPISLGLSYLPAVFSSDHRALHDRLAGTRVVQE